MNPTRMIKKYFIGLKFKKNTNYLSEIGLTPLIFFFFLPKCILVGSILLILYLNFFYIHFSKYKVKLCAHIKKNTKNHDEFVFANQ